MTELLNAALSYARQGWPVFPLIPGSKKPLGGNGVLDATTDLKIVRAWWERTPDANIGLDVGGAGMMVIDLDPGHDLRELEASVGKLPVTKLSQSTPRGGQHLFFDLAEGEIVAPSASKLAPHVDVRSFHSYVALAPSITDEGAYTWSAGGHAATPAFRTDELLRKANSGRSKSEERDTWLIEPDLPENVERASRWLRREAKIAVEGRGGDHTAYATAAMMKSFGLSEETALDLMLEYWNPRCVPPWGEDEYEHLQGKVTHAYEYNTSPPGNMTEAYKQAKRGALFSPVERKTSEAPESDGREVKVGRFRIVNRDGLAEIKPPEWLVTGLMPVQSYAILHGAPGTFKSFLALDLALSIATPAAFPRPSNALWPTVPVQGEVLYVAGEGRDSIKKRVRAWEMTHNGGEKVPGFFMLDPVPNVGSEEDIDCFLDAAQAFTKSYALVVIDTVGRAMQGLNENAQQDASRFTQFTQVIRAELNAATLGVHHEGHGDAANGRARGSSVFPADADVVLRTVRKEREPLVALYNSKQKDAPELDGATWAKLTEVSVDGATSLVVERAKGEEVKAEIAKKAKQNERSEKDGIAVTFVLDKALEKILKTNKIKEWSTREIAEAMAMRQEVEVGSKTLQNRSLVELRETNGTVASRSYDPVKKKWRWQD